MAEYTNPDEQKIRELVQQWAAAANKGDADAVVKFYAPDATLVWPDEDAVQGSAAIRARMVEMFKTPGLKLKFESTTIQIASGKDMASEFGVFTYEYPDPATNKQVVAVTKYVVVWRKIGSDWKVMYDCYNYNKKQT